jgi:hypothetical protein
LRQPANLFLELSRAWDSFRTDGALDLSYSFDRFADRALVIATVGAVVALFVAALV